MKSKIKTILGIGLSGGYGSGKYKKSERVGFAIDVNDYSGPEGKYHDEWAARQNGGGQELVEDPDGEKATRVYAGGTLNPQSLEKLGVTENKVYKELEYFLKTLGSSSRLDKDVILKHGKFKYTYKVLKNVEEIPVVVGEEEIRYGYENALVFVHYLINSPIK